MTYASHTQTAEGYRRDARRYHAKARRNAERAAGFYGTAHTVAKHAAWLTRRPDLWKAPDRLPAAYESEARTWASIGDTFLSMSFADTGTARHYTHLAASYTRMARSSR